MLSRFSRFPSVVFPQLRWFSTSSTLEHLLVERRENVVLITLNRPKALNALCDGLITELNQQLTICDADPSVGAIVLTGSKKAFAAGADIKEMAARESFAQVTKENMLKHWENITQIRKPILAAVSGYALGGGCELAMSADIIYASDDAQFGQPEILLATIPGCGGTQRLPRYISKSKAMEMILTGDRIDAAEAEKSGLVARVVPSDELLDYTLEKAKQIANLSQPIVALAKDCVNAAYEMPLTAGLAYEKRSFHATWATKDRKEGMEAFMNKRHAEIKNE